MKKIITGIALGTVLLSNSAFANSAEEEMKLYKAVTLSRAKIERDFYNWANYNRVINDYFNRLRINKDKRKSEELDSRLKKAMAEYSGKSYLTAEDDKIYNLILNIYYRNILLKDYFLKDYNSNSNNNDIRVIIDKDRDNNRNNNSNNRTDYNRNGSLAYNYRVLSGWHQERVRDGEMRLLRGYNSETQDSIHFLITDYNRYSRFSDFADAYKDELTRDNNVRNLRSTSTTLDWKTAYRISYDTYDSDEKTVYLVEYNGMVLIVNATKKYKSPSSSNNDITQIIDSIRIARDSNSLRDYNNNNNSNNNNNNNNNYNRNGSLSYNFKYPNGWNQEKWSSVTTLYRNNNNQDYVRFTIRDYNRFSNFNDFFEDYKNDVLRNSWIRNFRSSSTYIDGKSGYRIEYEDYNSDERTIYLIEYNGMVLVVEIKKRNKNSSVDNDVNEIINSIRISN